ncbi:RNA polymerase Rpb4-domain-containing protein [Hygrophoropsis aurantiaca]|uniref:RNA polymerase Rpb4-domain-containing protein n=1 Tax=Hygrophoropsis aurantiaca TaxID=72124 RepID=A0ACB8AHR6_9AGAM|nr:RNA polymerase Rpb4-domain-containing protein [Hygrophoropsis aurantiaca]
MEVKNPRSALLSNFEVLSLLRELDADHIARTKAAVRVKKEEDASAKHLHDPRTDEISENLRTIELEAIQYLSADYQPTRQQSPAKISQLVRDLAPFNLTKAEKLQIVNLAPTELVELYVIVEELEDRLGDRMHDLLAVISKSVDGNSSAVEDDTLVDHNQHFEADEVEVYAEEEQEGWAADNDIDFDDTGEGIGVEGDLDVDDD